MDSHHEECLCTQLTLRFVTMVGIRVHESQNKQRKVRAVETKEEEEAGKKEEKRRAAAAASAVTRVTGTTIVALLFVFVIEFHFL